MSTQEVVDSALAQYITAMAAEKQSMALRSQFPPELIGVVVEKIRSDIGEKAKFNNIMNKNIADSSYIHNIGLGRALGTPLMNITPYPGYGATIINNTQQEPSRPQPPAPIQAAPAPIQAAPAPIQAAPAPIQAPVRRQPQVQAQPKKDANYLWPILTALAFGTAGGLGGYILGMDGDGPTEPEAAAVVEAEPLDPGVGVEIDG